MSNTQLFFALFGAYLTIESLQTILLNVRLSDLQQHVNQLIQYMVGHEGRISTLEERTKGGKG